MSQPTFKFPSQAVLVETKSIDFGQRTRTDYGDLEGLANSIRDNGLIHPPVIDAQNRLIAGGRRCKAMYEHLGCTYIPVIVLETLDDTHLAILEAEENIRRKAPTWQERVLGVEKVHLASKRSAILNARKWTIVETGEVIGVSFASVNNALILARYIHAGDKDILSAATITDALKVLISRREREAQKLQADHLLQKGASAGALPSLPSLDAIKALENSDFFADTKQAIVGNLGVGVCAPTDDDEMPETGAVSSQPSQTIPLSKMVYKGDMAELCYQLGAGSVHHVICDPPYGIDMTNLQQQNTGMDIESVRAEHDVESNLELFPKMMKAVYYVLKDGGFFIFFYDLDHHEKLVDLATKTGFRVQRWPLVWHKTHTCLNQAAQKNFTKNYEVALVCSKGNSSLLTPQASSVFAASNDELKVLLGHPFVKPLALWKWIFSAVAIRGQTVLDPFAGVGSSTVSAIDYGLLPIAFEVNADHYDRLVVNTANAFKKLNPNIKFS